MTVAPPPGFTLDKRPRLHSGPQPPPGFTLDVPGQEHDPYQDEQRDAMRPIPRPPEARAQARPASDPSLAQYDPVYTPPQQTEDRMGLPERFGRDLASGTLAGIEKPTARMGSIFQHGSPHQYLCLSPDQLNPPMVSNIMPRVLDIFALSNQGFCIFLFYNLSLIGKAGMIPPNGSPI